MNIKLNYYVILIWIDITLSSKCIRSDDEKGSNYVLIFAEPDRVEMDGEKLMQPNCMQKIVMPCNDRLQRDLPIEIKRHIRVVGCSCDCNSLLQNSIKSLISWAENSGMNTAFVRLSKNSPRQTRMQKRKYYRMPYLRRKKRSSYYLPIQETKNKEDLIHLPLQRFVLTKDNVPILSPIGGIEGNIPMYNLLSPGDNIKYNNINKYQNTDVLNNALRYHGDDTTSIIPKSVTKSDDEITTVANDKSIPKDTINDKETIINDNTSENSVVEDKPTSKAKAKTKNVIIEVTITPKDKTKSNTIDDNITIVPNDKTSENPINDEDTIIITTAKPKTIKNKIKSNNDIIEDNTTLGPNDKTMSEDSMIDKNPTIVSKTKTKSKTIKHKSKSENDDITTISPTDKIPTEDSILDNNPTININPKTTIVDDKTTIFPKDKTQVENNVYEDNTTFIPFIDDDLDNVSKAKSENTIIDDKAFVKLIDQIQAKNAGIETTVDPKEISNIESFINSDQTVVPKDIIKSEYGIIDNQTTIMQSENTPDANSAFENTTGIKKATLSISDEPQSTISSLMDRTSISGDDEKQSTKKNSKNEKCTKEYSDNTPMVTLDATKNTPEDESTTNKCATNNTDDESTTSKCATNNKDDESTTSKCTTNNKDDESITKHNQQATDNNNSAQCNTTNQNSTMLSEAQNSPMEPIEPPNNDNQDSPPEQQYPYENAKQMENQHQGSNNIDFIELMQMMSHIKSSFLNSMLQPTWGHTVEHPQNDDLETSNSNTAQPELSHMVVKMIQQLEKLENKKPFVAIIMAGKLSDLEDPKSELKKSIDIIKRHCGASKNTAIILTGSCPAKNNMAVPILATGVTYEPFSKIETLVDVPKFVKNSFQSNKCTYRFAEELVNDPIYEQFSIDRNDRMINERKLAEALVAPFDIQAEEFYFNNHKRSLRSVNCGNSITNTVLVHRLILSFITFVIFRIVF